MITYPLNNILYNAEDAELYTASGESGIYSLEDFVLSRSGNQFTVGEGIAKIRNTKFSGKVVASKVPVTLTVEDPVVGAGRYDVIAIQFDAVQNESKIIVKKGEAGGQIPERKIEKNLYELYLYVIEHYSGTPIEYSAVTDLRRDQKYCGLAVDRVVEEVVEQIMLPKVVEVPVRLGYLDVPFVFVKTGNTVVLNVDYLCRSQEQDKSGETYIDVPEGFSPIDALANMTVPFFKTEDDTVNNVGVVSFESKNQIKIMYNMNDVNYDVKFSTKMVWITESKF